MNIQEMKTKVANNILEFLIDPTVYPPERHIYFRPEEILDNSFYENAKADSNKAYGDQRHNSDFYPNRPIREASSMERKTIIASLDVLSQTFNESDPIAKDLRTMAYAVAKMSEEELKNRLVESKEKMVKCPKCGGNVMEKTGYCLACKKKISEMKKAEEEVPVEKEAGKVKGPGVPDGTGPMKDSPECPYSEKKKEAEIKDFWNKEATDAVRKSLIAEVSDACDDKEEKEEKEAKEAPAEEKPEEKEVEAKETPAEEKPEEEEKSATEKKVAEEKPEEKEAKKAPAKEEVTEEVVEEVEKNASSCGTKKEEKEEKEATKVDTDILNASSQFDGIELQAGLITSDDIGDLSKAEEERLSQLFK